MSNINLIILLGLIILLLIYLSEQNILINSVEKFKKYPIEFKDFINENKFYNEKNELINHKSEEIDEQYQAYKYLEPNDIVLELGGRYGTVSVVINKKIINKKDHVVVEPDSSVITALEKNKLINNSEFMILPKFISNSNKKLVYDGYSTRIENSDNNNNDKNKNQISYKQFKDKYGQKFNVLIADCEGCLYEFLEMMGDDFNLLNKVMYEADQPHLCDYDKVKKKLLDAGFKLVDNNNDFRFVYIK